jgi:abequosyltransferase
MNSILSICIPTFNRPNWLLIALNSIYNSTISNKIEICISNNASDEDYSNVENLLSSKINSLITVNYFKHEKKINIDENHQFVINMSKSEHVFLLGDDDFFLNDQLPKLINFVIQEKPDLAIFNGLKVDGKGNYFGTHFDLPHRRFSNIEDAFFQLRDKGSFGAVLTMKKYFNNKIFERFYGTQHGYGIFWIGLFEKDHENIPLKISIPDFQCVGLRYAEKTYNKIEITYNDIPMWFNIFYFNSKYPKYKKLVLEYYKFYFSNVTSLSFFQNLFLTGNDITVIPNFITFDSLIIKLKIVIVKVYNRLKMN